jgi:D-alanyl-D-alanine carboxypeptidase
MSLSKFILLTSLASLIVGLLPTVAIPRTSIQLNPTVAHAQSHKPDLRQLLDDRVKGIMERQHIPGMAVVVIKDGQVQELKGYGVTDITTKKPVSPDTNFVIGSNTKPFTAMAIMMLVEDGKVNLDKPISQYLADLPPQWKLLTLRQLLNHTSGISEDGYWRKRKQPKDLIKLVKPELDFTPGETWMYSNSGFTLAGLAIEQVSGQPYGDFLRDRIFKPLGMQQTQAKLEPLPNLATGYEWKNDRLNKLELKGDQMSLGAGNIISTASDMAKWVQALDQGKLLSASGYQQLWTSATLQNGRTTGYGLGWFVDNFNGHSLIQHGGNGYGYSSGLNRYPKDQLDVIILANNIDVDGERVAGSIASIYEPTVSIVGVSPKPDPNPAFTQRFLALLQGNDKILPLAPELQLQRRTLRGKSTEKYMKDFRKIETLEFLLEETKNGDRVFYYRTSLKGKPVYAVITITAQQQVASYGAVSLP